MEEDGKLDYVVIQNAGSSNGGIMPITEQHGDAPPYWLAYSRFPRARIPSRRRGIWAATRWLGRSTSGLVTSRS
jgi:hypothetical protein